MGMPGCSFTLPVRLPANEAGDVAIHSHSRSLIPPPSPGIPVQKNLKLMLVAGARPNFVKLAPLVRDIQRHNSARGPDAAAMELRIVHTGQHYDTRMSQVFFDELGIPAPDFNLEVGSGSHAAQTAEIMRRFEPVCQEARPDWVVVVGDVNSTMACALVAAKLGTRVAHVEAGLRSFDRTMPEEINRLVTTRWRTCC